MTCFDLVIFDCDGVLTESEGLYARALSEAITAAGLGMTQQEANLAFSGSGQDGTRDIIAAMGLPADDVIAYAAHRVSVLFAQGVEPVEGMQAVLERLEVDICVASNSGVRALNESLGRTPLAAYFGPHVYSADHVARGKPAPDLALHCLEKMGCTAERAIFVDDNIHGVCSARDAGILSIGFVGPSDHRPNHAETLRNAGADYVVHGAEALAALLDTLLKPAAKPQVAE